MCNFIMIPTIKFMILQSFGNSTRCWISCWIRDFCILPPTLNYTLCIKILVKLKYSAIWLQLLLLAKQDNFFSKIPTLHCFGDLHFCCLRFFETNQFLSTICMYFCWRLLVCLDWFKQLSLTEQNQCSGPFILEPTWNSIFNTCYNVFRQKCTVRCNILLQFWIFIWKFCRP